MAWFERVGNVARGSEGSDDGFTVEFTSFTGATIAVVTLDADAIRLVAEREIAHVRQVA